MALQHKTKWFGARDAKIAPVTADTPAGITYGTRIDVPGIKTFGITGDVNSTELRGDNRQLAADSTVGAINVAFGWAMFDLDILLAILGGELEDQGVSPTQRTVWGFDGGEALPPFGFWCQAAGTDFIGGGGYICLAKVTLTSFPEMGMEEEDYRTPTGEGTAVKPIATGVKTLYKVFEEQAVDLADLTKTPHPSALLTP
jgi:hypothetical protein